MRTPRVLVTGIALTFVAGCTPDSPPASQAQRPLNAQPPPLIERADSGTAARRSGDVSGIAGRESRVAAAEALAQRMAARNKVLEDAARAARPEPVAPMSPPPAALPPALLLNPGELALVPNQHLAPTAAPAAEPNAAEPSAAPNRPAALPDAQSATTTRPAALGAAEGPTFASGLQTVVAATTTAAAGGDDAMSRRFAQHVREYPHDAAGHLDDQLLRFLRDEPAPSLDAMTGLPPEDREMVAAVVDAVSNFRLGLRTDPNMLTSKKVRPILEAADRIRSRAELTIPTLRLCSRVQGFGVYEPMGNTFRAGQDVPIILYCEVENFSSRQNDNQMWETKLTQEVVVYTETGFAAWRDKTDIPADLSRNRRHDFYVFKRITLPKTLSVGRYIVKVSIVDEQVKRFAENSVTVDLVAQ